MTTEPKFTKGPWWFAEVPHPTAKDHTGYRVLSDGGFKQPVVICGIQSAPYPVAVNPFNPRLIAAAPELFAALEAQAFADADPEAARRKGYYDEAKRLRDEVLRKLGSKAVRP